jgi:hypothetical protein
MTPTKEQKRQIAALNTSPGYELLLQFVVRLNRDQALEKLNLAKTRDEVTETAYNFRAWNSVLEELTTAPKNIETALKEEKDEIYG